jgi:hypothetical protein
MKLNSLIAITLSTFASAALAAPPVYLITHNETDLESNAYIKGNTPSPYPTPPASTRQIYWNMVRIACYGRTNSDGTCSALVKMAPNSPSPIEVGYLTLNMETGDITPKRISGGGYSVIVNGPGEATIVKQ